MAHLILPYLSPFSSAFLTCIFLMHVDRSSNKIITLQLVLTINNTRVGNHSLFLIDLNCPLQISDVGALAFKEAILERNPPIFIQLRGKDTELLNDSTDILMTDLSIQNSYR
jgi:hypothetical protein